ncbi:AMP-binding protein [Bordetella genomosp. 12]|uniref:AMP-binding protein n=1 Tax=Bordetella genomosp. 12 TaxID=463035 RepID=UPI001FC9C35A|nr:AMP-binding protein [Bordetella genomosp. 12]
MKAEVQHHIPGVVYPSPHTVRRYVEAGALTDETLVEGFQQSVARFPDHIALQCTEQSYSYRQLDDITDRLGGALLKMGVRPLDRAVLQLGNSPELVIVFLACLKAGIIPICTLAAHREHEIGFLAELGEARLHIVQGDDPKFDDVEFARQMQARIPGIEWIIQARGATRDGAVGLHALANGIEPAEARQWLQQVCRDPLQVAVFQLSGGTTGAPKIIPRFHSEYLYNMRSVAKVNGYTSEDALFMPLPMVHNLNMGCCFGPFLMTGGTVVLAPSMSTADVLQTLQTYQPTWLSVGALLARIQPALDSGQLQLRRLRGVIAPNGGPRLRQIFNAPVRHIFGMTEGVIMLTREEDPQIIQDYTVGRPVSEHDRVKLLVPGTDQEITEDEVDGECAFSGPYTIHGYYKAEDRNREQFTADGFYRSGDLMMARTIDGVRYFQFRGRTKDVVSRGGEKINCEEVEILIRRHAAVTNVQICAMPDPVLGERACAFIQAKPGQTAPDVAALGAFLKEEGLAKFKWPERVESVDEFPMTKTGKLSKVILRQLIVDKLAAEAAAKKGETE